ncbi:MAG: hypothetical protein AUH11_04040 [Acidobacteria bacterium 13_2_20CM_57_17]|nr:MAG: hypothetical protein AUH11_04040 [Acidobacteria bacterium 13_2_20CM_57_17]OLB95304.1 MAG: hypothetical protein AUI02_03870 [Acidobacteria bacterium 13_2_20CM_2_57_12]OLE16800.1 MAG: hypothetical protein AUG83_01575 [Acidobacteria bacterium 13_1_20CM_4_57_11]
MFFISFVMVRKVNYSVNHKQYAVAANVRGSGHKLGRKVRSPYPELFVVLEEKFRSRVPI